MKQTKLIMGFPITIDIEEDDAKERDIEEVFSYFHLVDEQFSTYKKTSEVSQFNEGLIKKSSLSSQFKEILRLAEKTKHETNGYFNIYNEKFCDPSGIVKGWAIQNASQLLKKRYQNFYIDAGGDVQVSGKIWSVGIKNPFKESEIVKRVFLKDHAIATSGTYIRGEHIYNPFTGEHINEIVSLSVIGKTIYDADRFATGAFAMGEDGIYFIEKLEGFEGYMIDQQGVATMTSGFEKYTSPLIDISDISL